MTILIALALAQDSHDYFPVELGRRWTYSTSVGDEITVEAVKHDPKDNSWVLETRGLCPEKGWPAVFTEDISIRAEGIGTHGVTIRRGGGVNMTAYGGSDGYWILKSPLKTGGSWSGRALIAGNSETVKVACRGSEQVGARGQWVEAMRVSWSEKDEKGSCDTDYWYAKGIGLVQGRMLLENRERRREYTWTLRSFEIDPTLERYECPNCGMKAARPEKCHEAAMNPFRTPLGQEILDGIRDLGAESIEAREKAEKRLQEAGTPALPALRRARDSSDAEVRVRTRRLLDTIDPPKR